MHLHCNYCSDINLQSYQLLLTRNTFYTCTLVNTCVKWRQLTWPHLIISSNLSDRPKISRESIWRGRVLFQSDIIFRWFVGLSYFFLWKYVFILLFTLSSIFKLKISKIKKIILDHLNFFFTLYLSKTIRNEPIYCELRNKKLFQMLYFPTRYLHPCWRNAKNQQNCTKLFTIN